LIRRNHPINETKRKGKHSKGETKKRNLFQEEADSEHLGHTGKGTPGGCQEKRLATAKAREPANDREEPKKDPTSEGSKTRKKDAKLPGRPSELQGEVRGGRGKRDRKR